MLKVGEAIGMEVWGAPETSGAGVRGTRKEPERYGGGRAARAGEG